MVSPRPTMYDIAREAGVSLKTVSRVVNGERQVRPETEERVRSVIERLGYRPNAVASSLARLGVSNAIGLVIGDVANPFYGAMTRAIEDIAQSHGSTLITASSDERPDREERIVEALLRRRVDGLIIVPAAPDHRYLAAEIARGTAVVFVDRPPIGVSADTVLIEDRVGARDAVARLLDRGHRRIGIVVHDTTMHTAAARLAGARDAFEAAGHRWPDELVRTGARSREDGRRATAEIQAESDPPTAWFVTNNWLAIGALRELRSSGSRPDVIVFDEFDLWDMLALPIAVVRYDVASMGRAAAGLLFERIGGSTAQPSTVTIPTELVGLE